MREDAQFHAAVFIAALRCNNKKCIAAKPFETHCECTFARTSPFGNGRRRRVAGSELATLHSIRNNVLHSAACAQPLGNVLMLKHPDHVLVRMLHSVFLFSVPPRRDVHCM